MIPQMESYFSLGDALEMMRALPDKSIDHVITDPPYEDNCHRNQVRSKGNGLSPTTTFELPFAPLTQETRVQYALEFVRLARKWILVFCQTEAAGDWKRAIEYAGGVHKRVCIWIKSNPQPQLSGDRPAAGHECFVAAYGGPGRSVWNGGGKAGTYQALPEPGRIHPTQKPIALMDQLVQDFTFAGEIILDPFSGSGTTLASAKRYGRRYVGFESDEAMYQKAVERVNSTDVIFDPMGYFPPAKQIALL